ncbi:MAG: MarR family transcriptional regulator [Candidatus Thermoplasmatota archaeon]|jgi:DNA-binding transcriptional ArsR family regulator|nr:MarR family transcriptional regulator [Candidatus Thermoplasmatota archaeon]
METELIRLTPSAKLVLRVLRELRISDSLTLLNETGLSRRSLMYSVKQLKNLGLVNVQVCLKDSRKRYYCISLANDI